MSAHTFASSVDEHSCVHSLNSNEIFSTMLVFVLVSEDDLGKRCTSAGIVYNVPDYSLDIAKKKVSNQSTWRVCDIRQLSASAFS